MSRIEEIVRTKADRLFFGSAEAILTMIEDAGFPLDRENARIVYAILEVSAGDPSKLSDAIALAESDWRDVLVAADLANENWERKILQDV